MPQKPQIVDITKSYLPGDPNAFVQNLVNTDREDGEEKTFPLLPYEGYNFLPTSYGYKSFFGTNSELGISALTSRCQFVLLYQIPTFKSRLIALCEDGIWVATADGQLTVWTQVVTHTFDADVFEEWTWCVIENVLYMYKQGTAQVYRTEIGTWTIPSVAIEDVSSYEVVTAVEDPTFGDFLTGQDYNISIGYYDPVTKTYSPTTEFLDTLTMVDDEVSVALSSTAEPPDAALSYLVYVEDIALGTTSVQVVASLPATISNSSGGDIVVPPDSWTTIALTDAGTGTGDFDDDVWEVFVQYTDAAPQHHDMVLVGETTPFTNVSIEIEFTDAAPDVAYGVRVLLNNQTTGDWYYKDFTTALTYGIDDLTGFTAVTIATFPHIYQQVGASLTNDLTITSFVPSFLNMAGQMGIFKAGLRLGFWDSANSVSWSSNLDLTDFTPSVENLAGNTIFGSVVGRIVHCRGHGEGFIVYSTKSVVGATFSATGNLLWDAKKILDNTGISFSRAVCCGKTDSEHFIFATTGIYTIGKYNALAGKYDAEPVLVEVYDLLKESRDPVYMSVLQDRYLCFSLIDDNYISGKLSFSRGWANPYQAVVDWYVPSVTYPAPTEFLLPEQIYEIIRDEMSGSSGTKRKDGEWIPRFTTTVDRMDDRYYSFASRWIGISTTGLASYDDYSTYFNTLPVELTLSDMNTYLNPRRPTSAPDASRYGRLYTQTGIRAFWGLMGVSSTANNEAMLYLQEGEWDAFIRHQAANKTRLEAYEGEAITYTNKTRALTYGTAASTVVAGRVSTITRTNTWTYAEGAVNSVGTLVETTAGTPGVEAPSVVWSTYPSTEAGAVATLAAWSAYPSVTITPIIAGSAYYRLAGSISYSWNGSAWIVSGGSLTALVDPNYTTAVSNAMAFTNPATVNTPTVIGTLVTGEGNNEWLITDGPSDKAAKEIILRRTFNKGFEITKREITVYTRDNVSGLNYREIATETTTYESADVTGTYGYSQFRALVTHWDRVEFGLYGDFTILETVAAEAMTAKEWEGTYPSDLGEGRDSIWSYGQYKSLTPFDLANGKLGSLYIAANDPDGTALVSVPGFSTEGITSLHTSFTLPGASFLLQVGSIEAVYPTFTGALVYDLHLKKWGKYKGDHKLLLETTPLNTASFGNISYTDLGANAGIFSSTGLIFLFDSAPLDSWLRYGKIGYYRQGFSNLLEIRASMRNPSDFVIITESSMDGKVLDLNKNTYTYHYDEVVAEDYMDISARWHTVKIAGNFDLTGLEVRATLAGRR